MRERTWALLFLGAWLLSLAGVWAAVSAVVPAVPHPSGDAIHVRMAIQGDAWTIRYASTTGNDTAFSFLREASHALGFELDWVEYGWPYYDVLVVSINGTRSDAARGRYWQYCVNGEYATRGALHQVLRDGDEVRWVYAPAGGDELCR